MAISTNELQRTISYAQTFALIRPLTGLGGDSANYPYEPAFTNADWVMQFILSPPFAWWWNRQTISFNITAGTQDVTVNLPTFGWLERANLTMGGVETVTVDAGGSDYVVGDILQIVQSTNSSAEVEVTAVSSGAVTAVEIINTGSGYTTDTALDTTGGSGSGCTINITVVNSGAQFSKELELRTNISTDTTQVEPVFIAPQFEAADGDVTFRILPAADQSYTVTLQYQNAAQLFSSLDQTWTPIPDYFSYLYNEGFLAKTYEQMNDPRFAFTFQTFLQHVIAANQGLTDSQINLFLDTQLSTAREQQSVGQKAQLSRIGRGRYQ